MIDWLPGQLRPQAPGLWLLVNLFTLFALLLSWRWLSSQSRRYALLSWWVIPPYLGVISGGLSPRLMGLTGQDWRTSLSLGVGLLFAMLATLLLVRATTIFPASDRQAPFPQSTRLRLGTHFQEVVMAGGEELHWVFWRGGVWEMILALPTPLPQAAYSAIWLAAILSAGELLLLALVGGRSLFKLVILLATTTLFFYTRNFWLCWLLHVAAWLLLRPTLLARVQSNLFVHHTREG
jgi:hypothetical protein